MLFDSSIYMRSIIDKNVGYKHFEKRLHLVVLLWGYKKGGERINYTGQCIVFTITITG